MDGIKDVKKWLDADEAISLKIGKAEERDSVVSSIIGEKECACGAPILCVKELMEGPDMTYNYGWHICLNPKCAIKGSAFGHTSNAGDGAVLGSKNIHDCLVCGRKF
jgi:hypothetical protein